MSDRTCPECGDEHGCLAPRLNEELRQIASLRQRQEDLIEERDDLREANAEFQKAHGHLLDQAEADNGAKDWAIDKTLTENASLRTQLQQAETALRAIADEEHVVALPSSRSAAKLYRRIARDYFAAPPADPPKEHLHRFGEHGTCVCGETPHPTSSQEKP